MFEVFRNKIFSVCSEIVKSSSRSSFLAVNTKNPEELAKRYKNYQEAKALHTLEQNVLDGVENKLDEFEAKEFKLLRKYVLEYRSNSAVDARHIREQLDIIQIAKNLKLIEANVAEFDPEFVHFEKLKARFLLEEDGAKDEFLDYVKTRPYLRPYLKWSDEFERNQIKLWPFH